MAVSDVLVVKSRGGTRSASTYSTYSTSSTSTSKSSTSTISRCFSCFAPITDDDDDDLLPSPSSSNASKTSSTRQRKSSLRSLSGSIKSFFSKSPLVKKLRSKRNPSSKSKRLTSFGDNKPVMAVGGDEIFSEPGECFGEGSDQSSSLFPSITPSSISSPASDRTSDLDFGQTKNNFVKRLGNTHSSYSRTYIFLVICLAVLVFWGKAYAIATCTSSWIFFSHAKAAAAEAVAARSGNWTAETDRWNTRDRIIRGKNGFG